MADVAMACALCGERAETQHLVIGERGAICASCVWLCVEVLEDRGLARPLPQDLGEDENEQSAIFDRPSSTPREPG